ncbi:MAG: putative bifunctional diguanylate cyclase/phosphodiesterase [Thiotrichales bacterium]
MKIRSTELTDALIMAIDDEWETLELMKKLLAADGYKRLVQELESTHALARIEEVKPDILLLNLAKPRASGIELLAALRDHPKLAALPVIILTASNDCESRLRALELGAADFLAKPIDPSELRLRVRNALAAKAHADRLTYYDPQTNLPNRRLFEKHLDWVERKARRFGEHLALLSIVIDDFSRIQGLVGQETSDELLRQVANRIESAVRRSDVLGIGTEESLSVFNVYQTEGGNFLLLLERLQSPQVAAPVAERILRAVSQPFICNGDERFITISIGIATFPTDCEDASKLLRTATTTSDYVRRQGGNRFQFSSTQINALYEKRLELESRLRRALDRTELELHYQPKVRVESNIVRGAEALIRWKDGNGGYTSPADFIPIAEDTGLIVPIGEWVLLEACKTAKRWHDLGHLLRMSVNISNRQFQDDGFEAVIEDILRRTGFNPNYLTLEITESLFIGNYSRNFEIMQRLRARGIQFSIDDFGTGYSSLSYLTRLPLDELKIDRSFVMDLPSKRDNAAIVTALIYIAQHLNLVTVAEGVETREQLTFLAKARCQQFQGYLFSKPIPADKFEQIFLKPAHQAA